VLLGGVVLALAFLWGRGRHVWYWLDEGISLGIATHPLTEVPDLLRNDGSPPLYYALLHLWTTVFGTSEPATHLLSLAFALAAVPLAFWAGVTLRNRRTGWVAVALVAVSPFVADYVNETRMYTLVVLLSLATTASFAHVFVVGDRRYRAPCTLCLTLLLYTHNWALFLAAALGAGVVLCAALSPDGAARKRTILDGALVLGAAGVLYLPWVPTLAYQLTHTGAPFSLRPTLLQVRADLMALIGGPDVLVVIGLGAGLALIEVFHRPRSREAQLVLVLGTIVAVMVALGWAVSRDNSVWVYRYLAVVVGPLLLLLAVAISEAGRSGLVALGVVVFLTAPVGVKGQQFDKSNLADVVRQLGPSLSPGDLVVGDFGRLPVLAHYLPEGLSYAETTGPVADPLTSDQRDATRRLRAAVPERVLQPSFDRLAPDQHLLVVCSAGEPAVDATEFLRLIILRCEQALALLGGDPRFRLDAVVGPAAPTHSPVNGALFTRIAVRTP